MNADFEVHYSKNYLFEKTSVHFLVRNLELEKKKFMDVENNKTFCQNKI